MISKMFNKTIAVFLTAVFIFGLIPMAAFAQPNPSSLGEVKGFNRSVFDSHFSRADREINPERWLAEAKLGISQALYAWELTALRLYEDPLAFEEERNKVEKWSDEELEKRFSQWLTGRFFGSLMEEALMNLSSALGVIQKNYSWHLDEDGNIIFDEKTGDPLIIRPNDEGRDFSRDLLMWRVASDEHIKESVTLFDAAIINLYPELLAYIPEEMYESIYSIIRETAASVSASIKIEFENLAAREERIFTSRRTRDIWSQRRQSDDEAAKLFTEKLVAETEEACKLGIEELTIRIEQAEAGVGDLALMGEEWLRLYKEQFEKGLKAWEEAEERFFIRRIEWEQESFRLFSEGEEIWFSAFNQFEEERQKWELKARELFQSGETLFKNLSEDFQKTIADAKKEFEINMEMRIGAGTTKVKALIDMYLLCSSAAISSKENTIFWMKNYGIGAEKDPADSDYEKWLLSQRMQIWKTAQNLYLNNAEFTRGNNELERLKKLSEDEKKSNIAGKKENNYYKKNTYAQEQYYQYLEQFKRKYPGYFFILDLISGKKTLEEEVSFANANKNLLSGNLNRYENLVEIQKSYNVYISYLNKALDARDMILADYAELIGTGALKDVLSPNASTEDFCMDEYQIALVRAKALVLYWERKTAIAEEVMSYAEEITAGRMTEAEGIRAWENAKAAYNESLAVYEIELKKLNEAGKDIQSQQEILDNLTREMFYVEEKLNKLNSDYSAILNISIVNRADYYLSTLNERYNLLVDDYKLFMKTGADAAYRTVLEYGLQWSLSKDNEDAQAALSKLLYGGNDTVSLAELEEKVLKGDISNTELRIRLAGIDLFFDAENNKLRSINSDYSSADWYAAARNLNLSDMEKAALYGDNLKERLLSDYKKASSLLLEKRIEYELEALINFLKEDHNSGNFRYASSEFCILNVDTAEEAWKIISDLKQRLVQNENIYTENYDDNIYISYFISGGSFFEYQNEKLAPYLDEYSFCIGMLDLYNEYAVISTFIQKETWNTTCDSLALLYADYGINQTGIFLPDSEDLFAAISKMDGDLIKNTAQFLRDFDNCFTAIPQWLEYEKENWKHYFMEYVSAKVINSGIKAENTYYDIYFMQEEQYSIIEEIYLYAYSNNFIEDGELELINQVLMETRSEIILLDYMEQITKLLGFLQYEEIEQEKEKHWRHYLENINLNDSDSALIIASSWKEGVLADALFNISYFTNRFNDSLALFDKRDDIKTEADSELNKNLYLEEASMINRKFSLLEYQYSDIANICRAYEFTQFDMDEISEQKETLSEELSIRNTEFNALREIFLIEAEIFFSIEVAYNEQYSILKDAHYNTDLYRFEYEKQDAIRRWASTAYLDKETIDPQYYKEKLIKAQTVMAVLSDIYNDEDKRTFNDPQYNALYSEYEQSFNRKFKALEALDYILLETAEENIRKEELFAGYKSSLNNLGYVDKNYRDYILPENTQDWTVKNFITVKDGRLVFLKDESMRLHGVGDSTADSLNEFFEGDDASFSDFELSLQALSQRMSEYLTNDYKLTQWGLARNYLILTLIEANQNIPYLNSIYSELGLMSKNGDMGKLRVKPNIYLIDTDLYGLIINNFFDALIDTVSNLFSISAPRYTDYKNTYRKAWEGLSSEEKADLEYYIILALSGNDYSAGFSKVYTRGIYELAYNYVDKKYSYAKDQRSKWYNFMVFWLYDQMIDINGNALGQVKSVYNETNSIVNKWKNGINENLSSIKYYSYSYTESCEKLAALELKKEDEQGIVWEDIAKALGYIKNLKTADIEGIRISWEKMQETYDVKFSTVPDALNGLYSWARIEEDKNKTNLETFWQYSAQERLGYEYNYQTAVESYLNGKGNIDDVRTAAENAFGESTAAWKKHLTNKHTVLTNDLSIYANTDKNFYNEFSALGNELVMLTGKALANRYSSELAAREIEWDFMLRDIEDKYREWLDSAALIFENGRMDWSLSSQKMQEAYRQWTINFENEYNSVNEEWTLAYLAGLEDKEKWLEKAALAANQASEEAFLSLLGTEGERLSRFMDTREPLGIKDAVPQAQTLMSELLQSAGIANMANAFGSINNITNTVSTAVKHGMGGVSTWNAVLVKSAAADLARQINADTAAEEAKKLAYTARMNANQIVDGLTANVQAANQNFRDSIDDRFIMNGMWRRSGNNYAKDVVKGSTLFDPVISETITITGYADFIIEPITLQTNLDEDFLSALDSYTIQGLIQNVFKEVNDYRDIIFGSADDEPIEIGGRSNPDEKRTQSPGKFGAHIGYSPDGNPDNKNITRNEIFYDEGAGELGRLLADFIYWDIIDKTGKQEQALPAWDKRMWDDTGSVFTAPTIRSVGQIVGSIAATVVTAVVTVASGGIAAAALPFLTAGISSLDDLIFGTLDATFGYKTWDEAGFEFGKALAINTATSLIGAGFSGITNTITGVVKDSVGKVIVQTAMAGAQTAVTNVTVSALSGITYSSKDGWGYNTEIFNEGKKDIFSSAVSSMASTFTTGLLQHINTGLDMEKLKGFNKLNKEDLGKLNGLTGSLAGQAVNYAFKKDITLNLFNLSIFNNQYLSGGLLELHIGRDGAKMNFGTGGANMSIDNLAAAFRGAQVWNVNNQIGSYVNKEDFDSAIALRAQYGYGDDRQKSQLWDILKGRADIRIGRDGDFTAETTLENGKRVINLSGYKSGMSEDEQMRLAVILGHEAYRDGIVTDGNNIETRAATQAHTEMAIRMISGGEALAYNDNLIRDLIAYGQGADFFNAYVDGNYDSSADYWMLLRDGSLINNNSGWLTDEKGKPILNAEGKQIGANGIETGLLNILFGGTHDVNYSNYSYEQILFAQSLMIDADMNYTEGEDRKIQSRSWGGNITGQSLNMQRVMERAGNTVASVVFARYYEDTALSILPRQLRKNINDFNDYLIPDNLISRFSGLYSAISDNYQFMRHFFDTPEDFTVTGKHGEMDPRYLYPNYENNAHFGTDLSARRSGDSIYLGIPGAVIHTEAESSHGVGNGNWMVVEYGYEFERSFIGSGIYGEYMHMERRPNFSIGTYLTGNSIIGTVGNTGRSDGAHLHYSIYTLENYSFSQTALQILLNNNTSQTVASREAKGFTGTYNNIASRKITYDIENYFRGLR